MNTRSALPLLQSEATKRIIHELSKNYLWKICGSFMIIRVDKKSFASLRLCVLKNLWLFVFIHDYSCWKNKLSQDFYRFFLKILARLTEKSYLCIVFRSRRAGAMPSASRNTLSTLQCQAQRNAIRASPDAPHSTGRHRHEWYKKRIKSKWSRMAWVRAANSVEREGLETCISGNVGGDAIPELSSPTRSLSQRRNSA